MTSSQSKTELSLFKNKIYFLILAALGLYVVYLSQSVLARLGVAVLCMVILDPLVKFFAKYMPKQNRFLAILVTFLFLGLIILLVIARLVPIISEQFGLALTQLNEAAEQAATTGQSLSEALAANNPSGSLNALVPYIAKAIPGIISFIFSSLASLFGGLLAQLMVFGFVLFGLIEGPRLVETLQKYIPKQKRNDISWTARTAYNSVTSYITGNLFISLIAGVAAGIFSVIIGLPYPFLVGIAVAICDLIPAVGAYLAGLIMGLFSWLFLGWDAAVLSMIFILIYQQIENQVLSPIVYNKANQLSPLTILVVVSLGGAIGGLLGALIAIPVGTTIKLSIEKYYNQKSIKETA